MLVLRFAKSDHSNPFSTSAAADAVVLLYDAVVVCKQALTEHQRRGQQSPLKRRCVCVYQISWCYILEELDSESYVG
jgi:hypothetical protein